MGVWGGTDVTDCGAEDPGGGYRNIVALRCVYIPPKRPLNPAAPLNLLERGQVGVRKGNRRRGGKGPGRGHETIFSMERPGDRAGRGRAGAPPLCQQTAAPKPAARRCTALITELQWGYTQGIPAAPARRRLVRRQYAYSTFVPDPTVCPASSRGRTSTYHGARCVVWSFGRD